MLTRVLLVALLSLGLCGCTVHADTGGDETVDAMAVGARAGAATPLFYDVPELEGPRDP